jgi:hypothetical protein
MQQEPPWPGAGQSPIIVRPARAICKVGCSPSGFRRHIQPFLDVVRLGPRAIGFWSDQIDAVLLRLSQPAAPSPSATENVVTPVPTASLPAPASGEPPPIKRKRGRPRKAAASTPVAPRA